MFKIQKLQTLHLFRLPLSFERLCENTGAKNRTEIGNFVGETQIRAKL